MCLTDGETDAGKTTEGSRTAYLKTYCLHCEFFDGRGRKIALMLNNE